MKSILRNAIGVFLGVVVGALINGGLILIGPMIIPPPAGVDMTTVEGMSAGMHLLGPANFIVPFLAHALGTFAGAFVAYFLAVSHKSIAAYSIGVFYLFGGIVASTLIPAPLWFIFLDIIAAYLPMAWLALKLASSKQSNT